MAKSKIAEVIEEAAEEERERISGGFSPTIDFQHVLGALATMPLASHLGKMRRVKTCPWCGQSYTTKDEDHICLVEEEELGFELLPDPGEQTPFDFSDRPVNCICDPKEQARAMVPLKNGRCAKCGGN